MALRLSGMRRDFPPSGNGVDAPRLVVFEVINLKPLKGEVPCVIALHVRLFSAARMPPRKHFERFVAHALVEEGANAAQKQTPYTGRARSLEPLRGSRTSLA